MAKPLVLILSPWAGLGAGEKAKDYLRQCLRDSLARNEAPIASHAMLALTQALYDSDPEQREEGLEVEKHYAIHSDYVACYVDKGISAGMKAAKIFSITHGKKVYERTIY